MRVSAFTSWIRNSKTQIEMRVQDVTVGLIDVVVEASSVACLIAIINQTRESAHLLHLAFPRPFGGGNAWIWKEIEQVIVDE